MTPMVSVIFLLIIFFLVAGTIKSNSFWDIGYPDSSSETHLNEQPVSIFMNEQGRVALGKQEIKDLITLGQTLQNSLKNGEKSSTLQVEIHADHRADSHRLIELLDELRKIGIRKIDLVTETAQP